MASDEVSMNAGNVSSIRLIKKIEEMTGIIYTYGSLEFKENCIDDGFMDIGNLNRFMDKTVYIPIRREKCLGKEEKRMDGMKYCKVEISQRYLIEVAMKIKEKIVENGRYIEY